MSLTADIYALIDPNTNKVRYVGKAKDANKRYANHLRDAFTLDRGVHRWIRKLKKYNLSPVLNILETVPYEEWEKAEQRWIAHYREISNLLNVSDGGVDIKCTEKQRKRAMDAACGITSGDMPIVKALKKELFNCRRIAAQHRKHGQTELANNLEQIAVNAVKKAVQVRPEYAHLFKRYDDASK